MLQARLQKVACSEGRSWLQFKAQAVIGEWHGVQFVQVDAGRQRCAISTLFLGAQARAVIDVLLRSINEGQATIDPRGVLECAALLDHGRLLVFLSSEHAAYGVDNLRRFMASRRY